MKVLVKFKGETLFQSLDENEIINKPSVYRTLMRTGQFESEKHREYIRRKWENLQGFKSNRRRLNAQAELVNSMRAKKVPESIVLKVSRVPGMTKKSASKLISRLSS